MKDCPHLSDSDRAYLLKLHDKALRHRLLEPEQRDQDVSVRFIDIVEHYYDLQPYVRQTTFTSEDLMQEDSGVSNDVMNALTELEINSSVVKVSADKDPITFKRVAVSPSPQFNFDLAAPQSMPSLCIVR